MNLKRFVPRRTFLAAMMAPVFIPKQAPPDEFDCIVIGAGSSGCVLAGRLSEDPHLRVLLIEAGGPETNPLIQMPGKWTSLLGTAIDWNYSTEPEPGLDLRAIKWPRGKSHGGSSSLNAMAYVRGHRLCYQAWARTAGDDWSYERLLPYFRRVEDNSRGASDYHGRGGPLAVTDTTDPHAGHLAFLEAARERGFTARRDFDFDGARQEQGAGFYQKNIRGGRRHSAAAAFLVPALARPNLTVWSNTQALRLTFQGVRATGVEVLRAGARAFARARREVILSAGAIESPKLLMLSGIGPGDALRAQRIPVVLDLPGVGGNLQDHLRVSVRWQAKQPLAPSTVSAGLFTYSARAAARRATAPPDVQFYVGRGLDVPDPFVSLTVAMSQPASRGRLILRSSDPLAPPVIRANYLSETSDMDAMLEGVRLAQTLASSPAYDPVRGPAVDPPNAVTSDADIRAFIRRTADTIFHPAGTCAMGTGRDAVVDPQLRVHGITGLRIADASIFPVNLNSQIHAACVVIGDKCADLLR
jgi:choline dehydrogenase